MITSSWCTFLASPALGSGGGYAVTYTGSYVPEGLITPVDVYTLMVYDYNPGGVIGSIDMCVGNHDVTVNPEFPDISTKGTHVGSDPFQAAIEITVKDSPILWLTPSPETAVLLDEDTNAYHADTHYHISSGWPVRVFPQAEINDLSLGDGPSDVKYGLGSIGVITAVPVEERTNAIDVMQIGVLRGTTVYASVGLWDGDGNLLQDTYWAGGPLILIPEPATALLLTAGALGVLRRRRQKAA